MQPCSNAVYKITNSKIICAIVLWLEETSQHATLCGHEGDSFDVDEQINLKKLFNVVKKIIPVNL